MTENKRFTMCHEQNDINGWTMSIVDWETKEPFNYTTYEVHSSSITDTKDEMEDLCLLLNEQHEQIERLKENFRALDEVKCEIADENEQLKQRNNRQYEQLGRLYDLIEQKEWRALTDIIDDFKKSDEQLQKEWMIYGDVE